jgi:hypothetical protein
MGQGRTAVAALTAAVLASFAAHGARADMLSYKNMPADKDVVLYQSGDRDLRNRVALCFWFRAEAGSFKITSERFREPIELGGADKPEQRVVCGSIITVRTTDKDNALQYAVVR